MTDDSANAATDATRPVATATARQRTTGKVGRGTSLRYYVCVGILVAVAIGMQSTAHFLGGYLRKSAVPLKRPLDSLDQAKLLPEYEPHRIQPEPLDPEVIANLGTDQYLQWNLTDRQRGREDNASRARVFITYYTGQPDPVPHNPKECLAAAGLTLEEQSAVDVTVTDKDGGTVVIPVNVLEFALPAGTTMSGTPRDRNERLVVAYFFYANGRYVTSRTAVRAAVSNLWDRYAYYSKIELSFTDDAFGNLADRETTIAATRRLLQKLMPILWDDHYQDWNALKNGAAPVILSQ
jgi:hypothetical protein